MVKTEENRIGKIGKDHRGERAENLDNGRRKPLTAF